MPYDEFVRAQILGNRYPPETVTSPGGRRSRAAGRRGGHLRTRISGARCRNARRPDRDIPFAAVETISTAFMGMTVGCAKCHDHKFDPISQKDYYCDEGALRSPGVEERHAGHPGRNLRQRPEIRRVHQAEDGAIDRAIETWSAPYKTKLYEERVALLTPGRAGHHPQAGEAPHSCRNRRSPTIISRCCASTPPKSRLIMPKEEIAQVRCTPGASSGNWAGCPRCLPIGRWKRTRRD